MITSAAVMGRSLLLAVLLVTLLLVGSSGAFAPLAPLPPSHHSTTTTVGGPPAIRSRSRSAATRKMAAWSPLDFLSGGAKKETPVPKSGRSTKPAAAAAPADKTKEPFVFLIGKPQYDWTTGKPRVDAQGARKVQFDWSKATKSKKSQK